MRKKIVKLTRTDQSHEAPRCAALLLLSLFSSKAFAQRGTWACANVRKHRRSTRPLRPPLLPTRPHYLGGRHLRWVSGGRPRCVSRSTL